MVLPIRVSNSQMNEFIYSQHVSTQPTPAETQCSGQLFSFSYLQFLHTHHCALPAREHQPLSSSLHISSCIFFCLVFIMCELQNEEKGVKRWKNTDYYVFLSLPLLLLPLPLSFSPHPHLRALMSLQYSLNGTDT